MTMKTTHTLSEFVKQTSTSPYPNIPLRDRLEALDAVTQQWLDPKHPGRIHAVHRLRNLTGLPEAMIHAGIDHHLRFLQKEYLFTTLGIPLDKTSALTRFVQLKRVRYTLTSPALTLFWMPGNLPGPVFIEIALAVLAGGPFVMRVSSQEPILGPVFWSELVNLYPRFSQLGWVGTWPHDDRAHLEVLIPHLETVVAYGYETALQNLRNHLPAHIRFLAFPHRISIALVDPAVQTSQFPVFDRLAEDIAWYNQLGCMSPQHVFIRVNSPDELEPVVDTLADALDRVHQRWPLEIPDDGVAMRIQSFRARMVVRPDVRVRYHPDLAWGIFITDRFDLSPTCGYRHVFLHPISKPDELPRYLTPHRSHLQTLGLALPEKPADAWFLHLARIGIRRFCAIGKMQKPAYPGCHDGRPRLADLMTWVIDESSLLSSRTSPTS